ncbi:MAG: glycosyltransferase WbuB [Rhodospirillaceae bacterium]|nr:MAG: glycosyltransferase WbuB [Rhodospirillaceae bacterium]
MKILYHHRTLSKDGQAVHIEELIAAFRRAGHTVEVVGPTGHADAAFGSDGGFASRVRALLPLSLGEILEASYSVLAFVRLWRAYRRMQPDLLYERYNLFLLAGAWLHRLTGVPFALEVNAPLALERSREPGLGLPILAKWCEAAAWRAATLVLPVTKVLAEHVIAVGVPSSRIMVIPNGIAPEHFPATLTGDTVRARHGLVDKIIIGFTGFLRAWHGLPAVIEVLAEMQDRYDVHFLVVGDGPARAELESEAQRLGVGARMTVTGVVGRDMIPAYVAAFDIAVQPKATAYASPLKLFEYMALGRAIVAPDQPNVREVLSDGDNALLFSPADLTSLKQTLQRLIPDPALRLRLGAAAAATVTERKLTWDGNAARITAAFTDGSRGIS